MRLPLFSIRWTFIAALLALGLPASSYAVTPTGLPIITAQPVDTGIPTGKSGTFKVVAKLGVPGQLHYSWLVSTDFGFSFNALSDDNVYSGTTTSILTIKSATKGMEGYMYRCRIVLEPSIQGGVPGSVLSNDVFLSVGTPPSIQTQPQAVSVLAGNSANFSVTASGDDEFNLNYQWYKGTQLLEDQTNDYILLHNVQTADAGLYHVTVTNVVGKVTSNAVMLTVATVPAVTKQPTDLGVISGKPATFKVTASGTATLAYQWKISTDGESFSNLTNNTTLAGANTATLSIKKTIQGMDGYMFKCFVSNAVGNATSNPATLSVGVVPVITTAPVATNVFANGSANLTVIASGSGNLSYQWYNGKTFLEGATNSTLAIANATTNSAGSYSVVVTNAVGKATSKAVQLTIVLPPSGVYEGTYASTAKQKGKLYLLVQDNLAFALHTATTITANNSVTGGAIPGIQVDDEGHFNLTNEDGVLTGNGTSTSFTGLFVNSNPNGGNLTLTGANKGAKGAQVNNAGLFMGTFMGATVTGNESTPESGDIFTLMAPDGTFLVSVGQEDHDPNGGSGTINAMGKLTGTMFNGAKLTGTLNTETHSISGNYNNTKNHSSGTFEMDFVPDLSVFNAP